MDELKDIFKEGEYYPFKILKSLTLPDNKKYYLLQDIYNVKHLLPAWYYSDVYQFSPNQIIDCKIDKINCNGKIFLEPKHPYFKEGELLILKVTETEEIFNNYNDPDQILFVTDNRGNRYQAIPNKYIKIPKCPVDIKAYLVKVSKGKLYLQLC